MPLDFESNLKVYALSIAEALFSNRSEVILEGSSYPIKKFKISLLRYVDLYGFRFVEQNPAKDSKWAHMARSGKNILWVFRGNTYYARIIDGNFILLKKE
jgi:hypothetical protein